VLGKKLKAGKGEKGDDLQRKKKKKSGASKSSLYQGCARGDRNEQTKKIGRKESKTSKKLKRGKNEKRGRQKAFAIKPRKNAGDYAGMGGSLERY